MKPYQTTRIAIALLMLLLLPGIARAAKNQDAGISSDLLALFAKPSKVSGFPYQKEMAAAASRYHLPLPYIMAVARGESFFDPKALSPKGAVGIMQVMPATAADYGVSRAELFDPAKNIDTGVRFLAELYDNFKDPYMTLGAYYCGAGGVVAGDSGLRQDCDDYVRYIYSHLQTIMNRAEGQPKVELIDQATMDSIVLASFDNFLDAEKFRAFLGERLSSLETDLFRQEVARPDHSRYQYQVRTEYRQADGKDQVCRTVTEATGFSFCRN